MDIEIGEYIRTDKGSIGKVIEKRIGRNVDDTTRKKYLNIYMLDTGLWTTTQYIVKYSKNIIDLIEVGDIIKWEAKDIGYYGVNEVIRRPETKKTLGVYPEEYDYLLPLERLKIIRVLPREQFEKNSYEVQYG